MVSYTTAWAPSRGIWNSCLLAEQSSVQAVSTSVSKVKKYEVNTKCGEGVKTLPWRALLES